MKVNTQIEIDDDGRGRVRAIADQFGLATRDEVREFVEAAVRSALSLAPAPRRRGVQPAAAPPAVLDGPRVDVNVEQIRTEIDERREAGRRRFEIAEAAPEDAICRHCDREKGRGHGKMGFLCMIPKAGGKGKMFEPIEATT